MQNMSKLKMWKKWKKNNLRILEKEHAHFQTMMKTPVKFQQDWLKIVEEVALTSTYYKPGTTHHAPRITHHAPRKAEY